MCGIFGSLGNKAIDEVYVGLKRLEYRGYDSFGFAALQDKSVEVVRQTGPLDKNVFWDNHEKDWDAVIGHVRWATNGRVSIKNSHPQFNDNFYVVHNGVVENAPKDELDTKWIVDLLDLYDGDVRRVYEEIQGDNAFVFINKKDGDVWCVAKGSKRLFVTFNGYVSSDINALAGFADRTRILQNGYCQFDDYDTFIAPDNFDAIMPIAPVQQDIAQFRPILDPTGVGDEHYMLSEIEEQEGLVKGTRFDDLSLAIDSDTDIIATGSSLHAAMFGTYALEQNNDISVRCLHASQAKYRSLDHRIIAISQSGETKDVINAVKNVGNFTCITNNEYSTLSDMAICSHHLNIGQENAVAATKTFTASCIKLCGAAGIHFPVHNSFAKTWPKAVQDIYNNQYEIKRVADRIIGYEHFLFLGDRQNYPIALEGALKFKEVAYVHAEGMPSSEMKHGPIALVDHRIPSLFIMTEGYSPESFSNIQEIKSRRGLVMVITHDEIEDDFKDIADIVISCRDTGESFSQSLALNIILQLLSYYIAVGRGINPDRPRNLAKCVTV